jgi:flagellar assembly factor FliW
LTDEISEIRFPTGLPGFPDAQRFTLVEWGGDDSPFSLLRSLDAGDLEFLVTHPLTFFPDYAPEVDDETVERLGLAGPDDALVLVIVTVPEQAADATANLAGPIVINRHTLQGVQAVLSSPAYDLRTPLLTA